MAKSKYANNGTSDYFSSFSLNNLRDLINIVKTYPKATNESNLELLREYQNGDNEALSLLVKTNMRLIIGEAKKHLSQTTSLELLDLIQEAAIAFMDAAKRYSVEEEHTAKFSTYATSAMKFELTNQIRKKDKTIRRSTTLAQQVSAYYKLKADYEEAGKELTDEEAMETLNLNPKRLKTVKNDHQYQTTSLDAKTDDTDDDSADLSNFISSNENVSDDIVSKITNMELFVFLKQELTDYQYYILMMRTFAKKSFRAIGEELKTSPNAIFEMEKKIHEQIRSKCVDRSTIDYKLDHDIDASQMRCAPIFPSDITKYMFYKELLSSKEKELLKLYIKGEYEPNDELFAQILNLEMQDYQRIKTSLLRKLNNIPEEMRHTYNNFRETMLKSYGSKIYTIDWDMDIEEARNNIKYIAELWNGKSYDEVIDILIEHNITITESLNRLLKIYFNKETKQPTLGEIKKAEVDINKIIFGFKKKRQVPLEKLYKTLEENKDKFSDEQYAFLMMKLFGKISRKDFKKKYPNSPLINNGGHYVVARLEAMYYNIANYKELNFTKNKYLQVRDQCKTLLSNEYVKILDLYFGYKGKKHTVYDIEKIFRFSYEQARDKLSKAKSAAQSIYLDRSGKRIIDADYYIPYVLDENIDLNPTHRLLLTGYLIQKKSYDELAKETGLSKHNVSSNILDALLKIDFYRFDILKKYKYPSKIVMQAIGSSKFTPDERKILMDLAKGLSRSEVAKIHNKESNIIDNLYNKHAALCHSIAVSTVRPTREDVERELNIHKVANLLTDNERIILAFTYGIKCDINPLGKIIEKEDFRQYYPDLSKRYSKLLKSGLDTISGKMLGIDRATLDIADRSQLKISLLDPRIPISEKERELLYHTFELGGRKYKDINELATMYNDRATSIRRRIQRAIATINRYENGEIQAVISYEFDVENNLRFFPKSDREILISKYRDGLTQEEIAKKHNLTEAQTEKLLKRLDAYLRDILDDEINAFDFDYYYEVIDLDDLPFYDNLEISKKMFDLYFEKRLSANDIKEQLDLDISVNTIQRMISSIMLATLKRKEQIKKVNYYTYEDVVNHYKKYADTMDRDQEAAYYRYFRKIDKALENRQTLKEIPINPSILLDLISNDNENAFRFTRASKDEAINILTKYKKELSDETIKAVAAYFGIKGREFMSSKEQKKVLKLLSSVNLNPEMAPLYQYSDENIPLETITEEASFSTK